MKKVSFEVGEQKTKAISLRVSLKMNDWLVDENRKTGLPKNTIIQMALENYYMQKTAIDSMEGVSKQLNDIKQMMEKQSKE